MAMPKVTDYSVIKRPHQGPVDWREQDLLELMACVEDPLYFMRGFMKVQHATEGSLPFIPHPFQLRIIEAFHKHRFCIALTGRQLGKCLTGDTRISYNRQIVVIRNLIKLGVRDRIVDWLERRLINLAQRRLSETEHTSHM